MECSCQFSGCVFTVTDDCRGDSLVVSHTSPGVTPRNRHTTGTAQAQVHTIAIAQHTMVTKTLLFLVGWWSLAAGFVPASRSIEGTKSKLWMANDEDLMRWAKASRSASANDRVVELKRPLGIVLNEDDAGNVYVETIAPKGNAARAGGVRLILSIIYIFLSYICIQLLIFGYTIELTK